MQSRDDSGRSDIDRGNRADDDRRSLDIEHCPEQEGNPGAACDRQSEPAPSRGCEQGLPHLAWRVPDDAGNDGDDNQPRS